MSQSKLIACDGRGGGGGGGVGSSVVGDGGKPPLLHIYNGKYSNLGDEFITLFLLLLLKFHIETLIFAHPFLGHTFDFYRRSKYAKERI